MEGDGWIQLNCSANLFAIDDYLPKKARHSLGGDTGFYPQDQAPASALQPRLATGMPIRNTTRKFQRPSSESQDGVEWSPDRETTAREKKEGLHN